MTQSVQESSEPSASALVRPVEGVGLCRLAAGLGAFVVFLDGEDERVGTIAKARQHKALSFVLRPAYQHGGVQGDGEPALSPRDLLLWACVKSH